MSGKGLVPQNRYRFHTETVDGEWGRWWACDGQAPGAGPWRVCGGWGVTLTMPFGGSLLVVGGESP